ncbi:MAG: protein phosphatase 2C domain-containing protein [Treponema sp.]|jgi:serine/threonine protein phosphatase PrpC|nr:protein phosphatase 2C domain-containing protein [Treponema sp.]
MIFKRDNFIVFACSVIGASHVKNNKPCQDDSFGEKGKRYRFIAVADGHGGEAYFRSDTGSHFAIEAVRRCVFNPAVVDVLNKLSADSDADANEKKREQIILQLKKSIVSKWNSLIAGHITAHPFTEAELAVLPAKNAEEYRAGENIETAYGSTIISVLWTDSFLLTLQIGDGTCVMLNNEAEFSQPVPVDEKCFLNVTTSLCDKNAIDSFRHFYSDKWSVLSDQEKIIRCPQPAAVLIGTDGIDDCFAGAEKLFDFYRVVLSSFTEKDEETAKAELKDYFPRLSEKGSGDDISIGIIADIEMLRTMKQ